MIDIVVLGIIDTMETHSYEPIPLTEEWLIKFGFDFDGYCSYWKSEIELTKDTMDEHFQSFNNVGSGLCQKEIKYVNQLQNLYFALTGEELTIKTIDQWEIMK